jgi:hypothetical protein
MVGYVLTIKDHSASGLFRARRLLAMMKIKRAVFPPGLEKREPERRFFSTPPKLYMKNPQHAEET